MRPNNQRQNNYPQEPKEFEEKIIQIKRVSKKTKAGNNISFSALTIVGDYKNKAGIGFAKGPDVLSSIKKAVRKAKDNMIKIELDNGTIPHEIKYKRNAARVMLRPAKEGTGVIAGGGIRTVLEVFGVKNVVAKRLGSTSSHANVRAVFEALSQFSGNAVSLKRAKFPDQPKPKPSKQASKKTSTSKK